MSSLYARLAAVLKAISEDSTGLIGSVISVALRKTLVSAKNALADGFAQTFSTAGKSFGNAAAEVPSSKTRSFLLVLGSNSIQTSPNWPCPPDCSCGGRAPSGSF